MGVKVFNGESFDNRSFLNKTTDDLNDRVCNGEVIDGVDIYNYLGVEVPAHKEPYLRAITFGKKGQLAFPLHRV